MAGLIVLRLLAGCHREIGPKVMADGSGKEARHLHRMVGSQVETLACGSRQSWDRQLRQRKLQGAHSQVTGNTVFLLDHGVQCSNVDAVLRAPFK